MLKPADLQITEINIVEELLVFEIPNIGLDPNSPDYAVKKSHAYLVAIAEKIIKILLFIHKDLIETLGTFTSKCEEEAGHCMLHFETKPKRISLLEIRVHLSQSGGVHFAGDKLPLKYVFKLELFFVQHELILDDGGDVPESLLKRQVMETIANAVFVISQMPLLSRNYAKDVLVISLLTLNKIFLPDPWRE